MTGARTRARSPHVLTVLHAAERTGPPLLALRFLRWLSAERPDWQLSTMFLDAAGPLANDFEALGTVLVPPDRIPAGAHQWTTAKLRTRRLKRSLRALGPVDLAHVHCAGSMRARPLLGRTRVLCHLHELSTGLDYHLDSVARRHITEADRYVAVSEGVRREFLDRFPVEPAAVDCQWGFVEESALVSSTDRRPLGVAEDSFVVLSSGVRHWRKAPELFVRIALRAHALRPDIRWRFVWIGGRDQGGLEELVRRSELRDVVTFVGHQDDPLRWVASCDVFVLPAREDAFPLVCVEAAGLGRPIITFENGGAAELVRAAGCGAVLPFPDVDGMANTLIALAEDPGQQQGWSSAAAGFAREHLTLGHAGPRLLSTMEVTLR